jgi:GMP synthase (glutamine-hydrolysing)
LLAPGIIVAWLLPPQATCRGRDSPLEHALDTIAVLDFGGQYAHLIANRVRRLRVYSEILSPDRDPAELPGLKGIILSGGPSSVYEPGAPTMNPAVLQAGVPILGLCYGHQLVAQMLGGKVEPGHVREYGVATLEIRSPEGPLADLGPTEQVWMSHGDAVVALPPGFEAIACTSDCEYAAVLHRERRIYGLQFHPEVTHTPSGMRMLDNFLTLCGCNRSWTMASYVEETCARVRREVGDRSVFLLVSGGIDSMVAFVLLNRALGEERVLGLHVDNGFMRKDETRTVMESIARMGLHNCRMVDASRRFLDAVAGVTDPQQKRAIIGRVFIEVRNDELERLGLDPDRWMLGQGTLYPDIIESGGTQHASVIKTHHNRVDLVTELIERGMVVEPLSQLYKDEVREVASQLGLPREIVWRHPFPGPGLSVRCLCSDGAPQPAPEGVRRRVAAVAARFGLGADLLPVRTVGVQGDGRTYANPAVLIGQADWPTLEDASTALTNEVREINRVVYLLHPNRLPRLCPKPGYLTKERLDLLREADAVAMQQLEEHGLMQAVFQMPTILLPLTSDGLNECVALRPLDSKDVMTARFAQLPWDVVLEMTRKIASVGPIAAVFYDVTHKPPATMEWE